MYNQAQMTMTTSDKLLGSLKNGMIKIEGLGFHSARAMYKILGAADYVLVCEMLYKSLGISFMYCNIGCVHSIIWPGTGIK